MYRVFGRSLKTLTILVCAGVLAAASAISAQSPRGERDTTANLTGAWTLNKDLSDDTARLIEAMQSGDHGGSGGGHTPPGGAGGGHGPGMHGGGGAGGNRGGMTPEQMRAMRTRMNYVLEAPTKLTIVQADGSVTLTDNDGRSQKLTTNNKKERRPVDNRMVDLRTKWDDERLVNETWLDDGMKLTETYSFTSEREQLQVVVKLEGSHLPRPINFRRVYNAESLR
jgi:hypothetical protein